MNRIKRLEDSQIFKRKKETPPKWSDKFVKYHLEIGIGDIISANIRDGLIRDDIWLFMWTQEEISSEVNIEIDRIKERRLLAPSNPIPDISNVVERLADFEWN